MALASFKDLCIDANDAAAMAQFWARTIGLTVQESDNPAITKLTGGTPQQTVWVNTVPEPKTVKNRVHFDVHTLAPETLDGASPLSAEGEFPWLVMADPDGGEFCAFTRSTSPDYRLYEIVVDAEDPARLATWWATVFDGDFHEEGAVCSVDNIAGLPFECFVFGEVPEPKTAKNRVHWDVDVADAKAIEALTERGATILRRPDDDISWTVMADPEGNEFCVFVE